MGRGFGAGGEGNEKLPLWRERREKKPARSLAVGARPCVLTGDEIPGCPNAGGGDVMRWYYTCPERLRDKDGSPETEGRTIVVSKIESLRWLENLKRSQRLTAHEERRKEEIMEIFHELYDISLRYEYPPVYPPWRPSW
jgi:hypothetical protein